MGFFVDGVASGEAPYTVASEATPIQSQATQFTGVDDSTGLFQFDYAFYLQGIFLRSDGRVSTDWVVDVGLEDPDNPGTYQYYNLLTQSGLDVVWPDLNSPYPANTRIRVTTNNVALGDLKAQIAYKY